MNNAHNTHDKRIYPGQAVELVLSVIDPHDKPEEVQEIARLASWHCKETLPPWFVESHIIDLQKQGWTFERDDSKIKVLTTGGE